MQSSLHQSQLPHALYRPVSVSASPHTPSTLLAQYLDTTGASLPAQASQDVWIIFSYWFLEATVCVEGGGTFILSTGASHMMSVHKIQVGWINDIVSFFIRLQNNFTKQSHQNIHLPEEKNEAARSKLNLENHWISGLREILVLLPRNPGRISEPEPGWTTCKDEMVFTVYWYLTLALIDLFLLQIGTLNTSSFLIYLSTQRNIKQPL